MAANPATDSYCNLADLFFSQASRRGPATALRHKTNGLYCDLTWQDYSRLVQNAAAGWLTLDIQPGDRVGILSENRYEWFLADLSILSAGAVDVPMHAPLTSPQVAYQLSDSGACWVVVSNQVQAEKIVPAAHELEALRGVVSFEPLGRDLCQALRTANAALEVISWNGLLSRGAQAPNRVVGQLSQRMAQRSLEDLATIIYTSGTTGNPKGVMLSHGNLLSNAVATFAVLPTRLTDVLLSWLPYSHIYARLCDLYLSIYAGNTVALAEGMDHVVRNLQETHPTHVTGVPRLYEKIWESVEALEAGERARRLHDLFGPRICWLSGGGAAVPVHVAEGFKQAGLPLLEGYGLTESSPVICANSLQNHRIGTVGKPIPGIEVRIAEDGEILTRGPHVMQGYWNKPEATAEAITADGWLHTGDLGALDADGFLKITGRKKDIIVTSGGKNIAPLVIEGLLLADPSIDQVVLYGDGRRFLSALIVPNFTLAEQYARERAIDTSDRASLMSHADIRAWFEQIIAQRLADVSSFEKVKKFILLDRPFSLEADELTATMKVRRQNIIARYRAKLDALYA